jgi:tRNA threonylcarbamoyl adenosine modification protein YeaZ
VWNMELAIDTSSNVAGLALSHQGELRASLTWMTARNHTVELLPNLVSLLKQARVELNALDAIIVAVGPGSFNGLRVGISTAKGLASVLNIPVVGVNTLEAEAYPFAFTGMPVRPVHRAGHEEVATALYRQTLGKWQCLEAVNLTTLAVLCSRIRQKTLFCGEIPHDVLSEIRQSLGRRAIMSPGEGRCRVASLALLGWQKLNRGEKDDPVTLQPSYLRPPHITKPRTKTPPLAGPRETREPGHASS